MSKKKVTDPITLGVAPSSYYLKQMKNKMDPELLEDLKGHIKKELKDLDTHMKKDGWDLDFEFIKAEIVNRVISDAFEWYLMARILKKGYKLKFKTTAFDTNRLVVTKGK